MKKMSITGELQATNDSVNEGRFRAGARCTHRIRPLVRPGPAIARGTQRIRCVPFAMAEPGRINGTRTQASRPNVQSTARKDSIAATQRTTSQRRVLLSFQSTAFPARPVF